MEQYNLKSDLKFLKLFCEYSITGRYFPLSDMQVFLSVEFYNIYGVICFTNRCGRGDAPLSLKLPSQNMFHTTQTNNLCMSTIHTHEDLLLPETKRLY
jgi:hypothetical protein